MTNWSKFLLLGPVHVFYVIMQFWRRCFGAVFGRGLPLLHFSAQPMPFRSVSSFVSSMRRVATY